MHYHILLTELCNSNCRYCYEKSMRESGDKLNKNFKFDFSSPSKSKISIEKLKNFLEKDKNAVLIFYGGEPLLEIEKIKEIIDNIKVPFRMQTNGLLLDKLPIFYLKKIDKILVSIDGTKERTDYNRGAGTYDKVMQNIQEIRKKGYNGEIIARMTISFPDIYEQVLHLVKNFNSIHWQLDAGFYEKDYNKKSFEKFAREYNLSIEKLINYWVDEMKKGKVIKLYPFIAIIDSLLKNEKNFQEKIFYTFPSSNTENSEGNEKTKLRCGAGYSGYAISTNGKIVACPIMNCMKDFEAGDLETNPKELKKFDITGKCKKCSYLDLCGGRCLYWNKTKLWPEEGDELICKTIKFYIDKLKEKLPEIIQLIKKGIIKEQDFEYEKYFGPEIIP